MANFLQRENKTGKVWEARIRLKGHPPRKKTFPTKSKAQAWAAEYESLLKAKDAGDPRLAERISLQDALIKYAEDGKIKGKKDSTLDLEQRAGKHLLRVFGANRTLADIPPALINQYQQQRLKEGYSNSAIRQELAILSKMFTNARRIWGVNIANPVDRVERVPPSPGSTRILEKWEAKIVLAEAVASKNKKFGVFVLLLMHTGMRSGEVARLKPEDVNFEKRSLKIFITKTNSPRSIPLTKPAAEALQSVVPEATGYYFLNAKHLASKDIMMAPGKAFATCWSGLRKRLLKKHPEIKRFRPHDLRHTAASHLLMAGVDVRVVADILGHSTLAMAMRYTHLLDDYRQDMVDKISHLGE